MKDKAAVIVLIAVAVGLGAGLIVINQRGEEQHKADLDKIAVYSNDMVQAKNSETELQAVNQALETNLAAVQAEYSNKTALSDANLHTVETSLDKAQADAKAQAAADSAAVAQRDKKIASLETENQNLDRAAAELRNSITNLDDRIAGTENQLAQAAGDRTLLLNELKQLQARKDNLESMFNDLTVVRQRVRELKHELALSRQADWIRRGAYAEIHEKGGERLMRMHEQPVVETNVALNIFLKENGESKITAPPPDTSVEK